MNARLSCWSNPVPVPSRINLTADDGRQVQEQESPMLPYPTVVTEHFSEDDKETLGRFRVQLEVFAFAVAVLLIFFIMVKNAGLRDDLRDQEATKTELARLEKLTTAQEKHIDDLNLAICSTDKNLTQLVTERDDLLGKLNDIQNKYSEVTTKLAHGYKEYETLSQKLKLLAKTPIELANKMDELEALRKEMLDVLESLQSQILGFKAWTKLVREQVEYEIRAYRAGEVLEEGKYTKFSKEKEKEADEMKNLLMKQMRDMNLKLEDLKNKCNKVVSGYDSVQNGATN